MSDKKQQAEQRRFEEPPELDDKDDGILDAIWAKIAFENPIITTDDGGKKKEVASQ